MYLVMLLDGPIPGKYLIPNIGRTWYFTTPEGKWVVYRLTEKRAYTKAHARNDSQDGIPTEKRSANSTFNQHSKAKSKVISARVAVNTPVADYIYNRFFGEKDISHCDIQTFRNYHLKEYGTYPENNSVG